MNATSCARPYLVGVEIPPYADVAPGDALDGQAATRKEGLRKFLVQQFADGFRRHRCFRHALVPRPPGPSGASVIERTAQGSILSGSVLAAERA